MPKALGSNLNTTRKQKLTKFKCKQQNCKTLGKKDRTIS
jgi:hypothetical protein